MRRLSPILLSLLVLLISALPSDCLERKRHYAFEAEYGVNIVNLISSTTLTTSIYDTRMTTNPISAAFIWSAPFGANIGLGYSRSSFTNDKYFWSGSDSYKSPTLALEALTPFIDLSPYFFEGGKGGSITDGFFVEAGPSFVRATETYKFNGSPHSFETSGVFAEIRLGFRTINKAPLSFVFRAKAAIPVMYDNLVSDTGFRLSNISIFSINAGICLSI